jgi:hypothetical protein
MSAFGTKQTFTESTFELSDGCAGSITEGI